MPALCIYTIPSMWLPSSNRFITAAAKLAGIDNIVLVPESQAAAAYYLHDLSMRNTKTFASAQGILICDGGGATSDLSLCVLQEDSTAGATTSMLPVRDVGGGLCGSQYINSEFLMWLDEQFETQKDKFPGGKEKVLQDLNISNAELTAQADKEFSRFKEEYKGEKHKRYDIHINGAPDAVKESARITVTR